MGSLSFRRFTHSSSLREIAPQHLIGLLRPHAEFLARHLAPLPEHPGGRLDYEAIAAVVLQPRADTPPELIDALWHVHEMSTPAAMESLLDDAAAAGIQLEHDHNFSPADVAVQVWLADPDLLRRRHAESAVLRRKSFESFAASPDAGEDFRLPDKAGVASLEAQAAAWFVERRRGAGTRVFVIEDGHEVRLIFRHGGPYRREGSLEGGEPASVHYRPMAIGAAVLDRRTWELRVSGSTKGEKDLYRRLAGSHLFGSSDAFRPGEPRYTLEPLRRDGRRSLVCADVPGLRHVRLVELRMFLGGAYRRARVEQADDVLLALEDAGESVPGDALLTAAKFEVQFTDAARPRPVTVRYGNVAQYARDSDADLVEAFLRNRGFVNTGGGGGRWSVACA